MTAATLWKKGNPNLVERFQEHWKAWLNRHHGPNGLQQADNASLLKIAMNAGLVSNNPHQVSSSPDDGAVEMPQMMQTLNIDPTTVETSDPDGFRTMQANCAKCANKAGCRADLGAGTAPQHYLGYCRNADLLNALRADPEMLVS